MHAASSLSSCRLSYECRKWRFILIRPITTTLTTRATVKQWLPIRSTVYCRV